jgi:hypothetical protein
MLNTDPGVYTLRAMVIPRLASAGRKFMPKPSPSLYASAVLIWLQRGELPDARGFDVITAQPPPTPNPHPWWLLHEAVTYAVTLQDKHGKVPWIKTGEQILTSKQITELYITMGDVSTFGSKT